MTMAIRIFNRQQIAALPKTKKGRGRKSQSLRQTNKAPSKINSVGGAYFCSVQRSDNKRLQDSASSSESSWKESDAKNHHQHSPLVARRLDMPTFNGAQMEPMTNEVEELGLIMARSRQLPGTWYYSSNHVLVNKERTKRGIAPLIRKVELDELARKVAASMAESQSVRHSNPHELMFGLNGPCRRLGENVASGSTIRDIHMGMMQTSQADKNNVLDRRYTYMGMGTARGPDGQLYLCQIFRG